MNPELLKVLLLPSVLVVALTLAIFAVTRTMPTLGVGFLVAGWLLAGMGLTFIAQESQRWPLTGYLQNLVAFLGLSTVPFVVGYTVSTWLRARGSGLGTQLGVTVVAALLAILPAGLVAPFWAMFLRSAFDWQYIKYP